MSIRGLRITKRQIHGLYGLDISHSEFVAVQIIFTHETFEELIFSTLKILMALDQGIQGSLKRVLDVVETGPYEK